MTQEELRRETGISDTVPYKSMQDRLRSMGIGSVVSLVAIGISAYLIYRWVIA